MYKKKVIVIAIMITILTLLITIPILSIATNVGGFNDLIPSHWAYADIISLAEQGIINGFPDGTYRPEEPVTREQFTRLIVGLLDTPTVSASIFDDVLNDSWSNPWVAAAVYRGIILPSEYGTTLGATDAITREEAAVWMVRALGVSLSNDELRFEDSSLVEHTEEIATAVELGLITGMPGNLFEAHGSTTRAQAATLITRMSRTLQDIMPMDNIEPVLWYSYKEGINIVNQPSLYSITVINDVYEIRIPNPSDSIIALIPGSIFVLEPTALMPDGFAGRLQQMTNEGTVTVITATATERMEDIYSDIEFVGSIDLLSSEFDLVVPNTETGLLSGGRLYNNGTHITHLSSPFLNIQPLSGSFVPNITRHNDRIVAQINNTVSGVAIEGALTLYMPQIHANITLNNADILVTAAATFEFKASANREFDEVINIVTLNVRPLPGVLIEIPIGMHIKSNGETNLEISSNLDSSFGIIRGKPSARVHFDYNFDFDYSARTEISLSVQAKASLLLVPIYGINIDLGKGLSMNNAIQERCPERLCLVTESFNIQRINSLTDWGVLSGIGILRFNLDFAASQPSVFWYRSDNQWRHFCNHSTTVSPENPVESPPSFNIDVTVSSENELRQAVMQAGATPTVIALSRDIELVSNFIIPNGASITLTSIGTTVFKLIATRDMDVITMQENTHLIIEKIEITRTPGTLGRGIVSPSSSGNTLITMNNGVISGHDVGDSRLNDYSAGIDSYGTFILNDGVIRDNASNSMWVSGDVHIAGHFTMNGGIIGGNNGGAVNYSGVFIMNNGIINGIVNNPTWNRGSSSSFTMNNGIINGNLNHAAYYNPVLINEGTINGNVTTRDALGNNTGLIDMRGGIINGNVSVGGGIIQNGTIVGSVSIRGRATDNEFTMNGGTIRDSDDIGVSIVSNQGTTFTMNGGTISGHNSTGVSVSRDWGNTGNIFNLNGGIITGNRGGGVKNSSTFIMSGGVIYNNFTTGNGGGVDTERVFTMIGGMIYGNNAGSGGGVNHTGGTFTIDGGWIFNNSATTGNDINIGQSGTFNNNVYDNSIGGVGVTPPGFVG